MDSATGLEVAKHIFKVAEETKSTDSLLGVVCDNTIVNTGHKNGAVACLEKMRGIKIHKIGCMLHWNELSLKKLIIDLDGPTASGNKWTGPIGSQFSEDTCLKPAVPFRPVSSHLQRPPDDVKDLSADQRLLLEYVMGISDGAIPPRIMHTRPGPVSTARWLTSASRILVLYARDLELSSEMRRIVNFILKVYAQGWFTIKAQTSFIQGPKILFDLLQYVKSLDDELCTAIFQDKMQKWAFCLLSENFLMSMLFSEREWDRRMAAMQICELKSGHAPLDSQRIQKVNFAAEH